VKINHIEVEQHRVVNRVIPLSQHRQGCQCMSCLQMRLSGSETGRVTHQAGCQCGICKRLVAIGPIREDEKHKGLVQCNVCLVWRGNSYDECPNCRINAEADLMKRVVLPKEDLYCFIIHAAECTCSKPVIVNRGMLEACESATIYMLAALKPDAKPRSGLTRADLDYLAVHSAKAAAHWGRRALGQQDLT